MSMRMKSHGVTIQVKDTKQFRMSSSHIHKLEYLVEHYKQYHSKVMHSRFI